MRRHDLITLKPDAVAVSVSCCTTDAAARFVRQWISAGRAFVCSRQMPSSSTLQLGLAFMERGVRHRAVVQVRHKDVDLVEPPLKLDRCLPLFRESDAVMLQALVSEVSEAGCLLSVFGSVSWEMVSAESYRTPDSDLDLLCDVSTIHDLNSVIQALQKAERGLSFSLDGELRFPNDDCVNWREAAIALGRRDAMEVLVKSETGVYLGALDHLMEMPCV